MEPLELQSPKRMQVLNERLSGILNEKGGMYRGPGENTTQLIYRADLSFDRYLAVVENITTLEFAEGTTEIPYANYKMAKNLTTIIIPSSVTSVGESVFQGCPENITIYCPNEEIASIFQNNPQFIPKGTTIVVGKPSSGGSSNEPNLIDYITCGSPTGVGRLFQGADFSSLISEEYPIVTVALENVNSFMFAFGGVNAPVKVIRKNTNSVTMSNMFAEYTADLIDLTEFNMAGTNHTSCFNKCPNLKEIKGVLLLNKTTTTSNMFAGCNNLEEVRFSEETIRLSIDFGSCSKLSGESRQSIIDGLVDLTGQTAQTVTFHADVYAQLTDEQKASATNKNWTVANAN